MKIKILTVGKTREKFWQLAESEFTKRIQRYQQIVHIFVKDASLESPKNVELAKKIEGEKMLRQISPEEYVVVLDRNGRQIDSLHFAEFIQHKLDQATKTLTFVIGGSSGLFTEVLGRANLILSFSKMTFPHEMFKVMLLEQIYRAFTIMRGEKYHK